MMDRIKIYQADRLIGTIPAGVPKSKSFIFDVRPGDFTPQMRDGEPVLVASQKICPGDFRCLVGFEDGAGKAPTKDDTELADTFDVLARAAGMKR